MLPGASVRAVSCSWSPDEIIQLGSDEFDPGSNFTLLETKLIHCPRDEMHVSAERMYCLSAEIHVFGEQIHCPRDEIHAFAERVHCPPSEIRVFAERVNVFAEHVNVFRRHMKAIWGRARGARRRSVARRRGVNCYPGG